MLNTFLVPSIMKYFRIVLERLVLCDLLIQHFRASDMVPESVEYLLVILVAIE